MLSKLIDPSKILRCELATINATVAKNLLETCHFELQRNLNEPNVERLKGEYLKGWFVPGTPIFFCVLPNEKMYLVNGQHSLTALSRTSLQFPFVKIFLSVKDMAEVGRIYSRLDLQRTRSWHDAYRAAGFEKKANFDSRWISCFGASIRAVLKKFRVEVPFELSSILASRQMQLEIFGGYLKYAEQYVNSLTKKDTQQNRTFRRSTVMGIGLELFRYQPQKAYEFFSGASADDGLLKGDPRKVMLEYLRNTNGYSRSNRNLIASCVAICWNEYFHGGQIASGRIYPHSRGSIVLDGTPWQGNYEPFKEYIDVVGSVPATYAVNYSEFTTGEQLNGDGTKTPMSQATPKRSRKSERERELSGVV